MPQPIYIPQYHNPWEAMLPTFLSQMILQTHGNKLRRELMQEEAAQEQATFEQRRKVLGEENEKMREFELQKGGYRPATGPESEYVPPDVMTPGGKPYYTPSAAVGKAMSVEGTDTMLIPQLQNGKIVGYQAAKRETGEQLLASKGIYKIGDSLGQLKPDGKFKILVSTKKQGMTEADLTARSLSGDKEAQATLQAMEERRTREHLAGMTNQPVGLEAQTNRLVIKDPKGALLYQDSKTPYSGGQLKPITEPQMVAMMNDVEGFDQMPEDVKNLWYETYAKDRSAVPPFYYRDPKSKNAFIKGFAEWELKRGGTGGEVVADRFSTKALGSSLQFQQKNRGMMGSFVTNINGQVSKIEKISKDIVSRVGIRALDLPRRELVTRFVGSGQERVLESYLKEVSAEIAKLSQGSAASIAQLPEGNRESWERIHDPNLSFRELLKVLEGTREQANIRLQSVDNEISETEYKLKNLGVSSQSKSKPKKVGRFTIEEE